MDLKYSALKLKIIRLLADESNEDSPIGGLTYSADMLEDGIHAALDAISARIWKTGVLTVEGDVAEADLPDDVIDVQAVFDDELDIFIPRMQFQIGQGYSSTTGNAWHLYPTGKLVFVNELGEEGATVYYTARWTKPDKDNDLIEPPFNTLTCLILYAASYCLLADSAASANIRQFNTKVDSGQPTDIPAKDISDFLLRRFEHELQRIPMEVKSRNQ